jgi:hypothetical protein
MLLASGFVPFAWPAFAQTGVPRPDHVVVEVDENKGFERIYLSPEAPYINALAQQGALFVSSFALTHPSQPNYLALFSGSTQGIGDDSCPHSFGRPNLASALLDGGFTFAGYSESLPAVGSGTCEAGAYARKHNPWVDFVNVPRQSNLPFTYFPTNFSQLPNLCFVIPNLNNDMHDGTVAQGDAWLHLHLDAYVQWAMTNNSLFILTQDEGPNGSDNRIITLFMGPMVVRGQYSEHINHFTLLRTLLAMYDLAPIGRSTNIGPITSCWTAESLNPPLTVSITSPDDGAVLQAPADVHLTVDAISHDSTVRKVEFFNARVKFGEATNSPFEFTLTNAIATTYSLIAKATDDRDRTWVSSPVHVRVLASDTTSPTVTITSPSSNAKFTNAIVTMRGTASDNVEVARVEYQVGDGMIQVASGTTNWVAQLELTAGTNTVWARSVDFQNNASTPATLKLIYLVTSALTVETNGSGTTTPDLNGKILFLGQQYTITAQPAPGYLFAGWSGGVTNSLARLFFQMQSNLVLRAAFVPNPFIAAKGNYYGLFYDTNQVRHESSGFVLFNTTDRGAFSGNLQSAGRRYAFSGQFDLNGTATGSVPRLGTNALSVEMFLNLDVSADQVHGWISDGNWTATLLADRAVFNTTTNPTLSAGQYTLDIPPDGAGGPSGDGFGTLRVGADGFVRLTGTLADGSRLTEAAPISKDGYWPFYDSLYGGKGSILGWLNFTNTASDDLQGLVYWLRPAQPGSRLYPSGFTNETAAVGSNYRLPAPMSRVINLTNGLVEFSGGDLSSPFTNAVVLGPDNKLTNLSSNRLAVTLRLHTGRWRGTATDPATGQSFALQGIFHQERSVGVGFFLEGNQSGRVLLRAP